jgi:glycosyltransferase involved in cell wall biosynthesis
VHTYHGHIFHSYYGGLKTRFFLTIERVLARVATDRIVAISQQQFREIQGRFGVGRAEQFKVIPLGLDLEAFAGWQERRAAARAQLGAREGELLVGIVGRLTEIKNHRLFIEAVYTYFVKYGDTNAANKVTGRHVRFFVIGDGHLREDLETHAHSYGVDDDIVFTGTRSDPENFYAALDIVALTSLNEGTPLTLIEAMANARAVVATAVGGVVDLVGQPVEGGTAAAAAGDESAYTVCERGVRVPTGDAEAFGDALHLLITSEDLRHELGERGRAFVEEHYSKERLVRDVLDLYSELSPSPSEAAVSKQGGVPVVGAARGKGD